MLGGKDQHREDNTGTLKVHTNGFGWKSRKTGSIISIVKADLRGATWLKIPHAYQLKVHAKGGFIYKFNGFRMQVRATAWPRPRERSAGRSRLSGAPRAHCARRER